MIHEKTKDNLDKSLFNSLGLNPMPSVIAGVIPLLPKTHIIWAIYSHICLEKIVKNLSKPIIILISQSLYWLTENLTPPQKGMIRYLSVFIGNNRTVEDIRGYFEGANNISADQGDIRWNYAKDGTLEFSKLNSTLNTC